MTALDHALYSALIEARALIDAFLRGDDMSQKFIGAVYTQIVDAVETAAGGPVDAAGDRI